MNVRLLDELSAAELVSTEALMRVTGLTLLVCEAFHTAAPLRSALSGTITST